MTIETRYHDAVDGEIARRLIRYRALNQQLKTGRLAEDCVPLVEDEMDVIWQDCNQLAEEIGDEIDWEVERR